MSNAELRLAKFDREALDEAQRLRSALQGVSDLVAPDCEIQRNERDRIATLLNVLLERLDDALTRLEPRGLEGSNGHR